MTPQHELIGGRPIEVCACPVTNAIGLLTERDRHRLTERPRRLGGVHLKSALDDLVIDGVQSSPHVDTGVRSRLRNHAANLRHRTAVAD